jgi:hypothetical protein
MARKVEELMGFEADLYDQAELMNDADLHSLFSGFLGESPEVHLFAEEACRRLREERAAHTRGSVAAATPGSKMLAEAGAFASGPAAGPAMQVLPDSGSLIGPFQCRSCEGHFDSAPAGSCVACAGSGLNGLLCQACFRCVLRHRCLLSMLTCQRCMWLLLCRTHERGRAAAGHVAVAAGARDVRAEALASLGLSGGPTSCRKHPSELLKFYCTGCSLALCVLCIPAHHGPSHALHSIADVALLLRRHLATLCTATRPWDPPPPPPLAALTSSAAAGGAASSLPPSVFSHPTSMPSPQALDAAADAGTSAAPDTAPALSVEATRQLALNVNAVLTDLPAKADAAIARLHEARDAIFAALHARVKHIEAGIRREVEKKAALLREEQVWPSTVANPQRYALPHVLAVVYNASRA